MRKDKSIIHIAASTCLMASAAAHADTWVDFSDWSHHLNRERAERLHLNERNAGIGIETGSEETRLAAGVYRNSFYRDSIYIGAQWLPLQAGAFRFGVQAGGVTGYRKGNNLPRAYVAGIASIEGERFGANLALLPPASDVGGGVITAQLKVRF